MNRSSNDYIEKNLEKISLYNDSTKVISIPILKDLLENRFLDGYDMKSIVPMFNILFSRTIKTKKNGFFVLTDKVNDYIQKIEEIKGGNQGYVFNFNLFSYIKIIIKISQDSNDYADIIREFFIGITEINKLRYIIPNFVYTYGAFICPVDKKLNSICKDDKYPKTPFLLYEKIPGNSMEYMLDNNILSFSEYLGIFIQILLALEIAQRTISFTHFDFHPGNLMCRTIPKDYNYNVCLDDKIYEAYAKKYLPVIIDFGQSTIKHEGVTLGSYDFPDYGMKHYMLPGVDMYKFLFFSCRYSNGVLQEQILSLISFYKDNDPYDLLTNGSITLEEGEYEYVKKCSYSKVTTNTPLEFLTWILENPKYKYITSSYMKTKQRDVYENIPILNIADNRSIDIFGDNKFNKEKSMVDYVQKYIILNNSYIVANYLISILNNYNKKLLSKSLEDSINNFKKDIEKSKNETIKKDLKMLLKYKKILLPNVTENLIYSNKILEIKIDSDQINNITTFKLIKTYFKNNSFFVDILPYLEFMYIIKEIKLEKIYSKFLESFESSTHYMIYVNNNVYVNKTLRWSYSLINSLK